MKFTYLLVNFFTILVPLLYSAEPRIRFYKKWKYLFPAIFFTGAFFIIWDYFMASHQVWGFNSSYILGWYFFGLPLEEFLFFITVPYACVFIYENVSHFLDQKIFPRNEKIIVWLVSGMALITALLFYSKAYTFTVFLFFGLFFPIATLILPAQRLNFFLLTYLISLIPMAIVNGLLTALPVVVYNNAQNLGIRIGTIPVEDFFYSATLLVMNISLYEWAKSRKIAGFNNSKLLNLNNNHNGS